MVGSTHTTVYFVRLAGLIPVQEMNLAGSEESRRSGKASTAPPTRDTADRYYRRWDDSVQASAATPNADTPPAAAVLFGLGRRARGEARRRRPLYPPYDWAVGRILWQIRYRRRNARLRARHQATMRRLRADALTAYRDFRERSGDLSELIAAERARRERGRRDRERRERAERVAAMTGATRAPVWAYGLTGRDGGPRRFEIHLRALALRAGDLAGSGLTAEQVRAALADERARDPYTVVRWSYPTRLALEEWHWSGDVRQAWRALTGEPIEPYPPRPDEEHGPTLR